MLRGEAGAYTLHECAKCFGVWVDRDTVENLCREAAREAVTGPSAAGPIQQASAPLAPIRYVKCPQCQGLMHRVNYGKSSGIVLDVCRAHGTWFDDRELTSIVAFIRAGGLDRAREREKAELAVERRRQATAAAQRSADYAEAREPDMFRLVLRSARGLFDTD
jgi:Zn-finger nucleic acid-binding protein